MAHAIRRTFGVHPPRQPVVPNLRATWSPGEVATRCMPLNMALVGDMRQFQMQDDSSVDYIQMILNC